MKTYLGYLNQIATDVEEKYVFKDKEVNWFHPYKSYELEGRKEELLNDLNDKIDWQFKGTKPYVKRISKGCELCGQGEWSCLFITGICNANCFYCPADQSKDDLPQTQKLIFENSELYINYINKFKFKGVSLSGGEPLMVFDRTLEFIQQVRKNCDPEIYIWMYTNGILVTDEKLEKLADAGLNEIRFDIGAVNYNPKVLKNAAKYIANVTVEIPAVPHHKEQLFEILPTLVEYGVTNLNLHQLRLTQYNAPKLLPQEYTFLHGEQPSVAESELTAFEIMQFVNDQKLNIGVNYCNFQYKNRFQKAGFRNKMADVLVEPNEEITQNGYLRKIVTEDNRMLNMQQLGQDQDHLQKITLQYDGRVLENLMKSEKCRTFDLQGQTYYIDEGRVTQPIVLEGKLISKYVSMIEEAGSEIPDHPLLFEAWRFEFIEYGMREYF